MSVMYKKYKILVSLLLVVLVFLAFAPPLNPPAGGWTQQFMPDLGGRQISDLFFLDSLNGWAVTPFITQNDTTYVLKTTNSGNNWFIQFTGTGQFVGRNRIIFLNTNTGFTCGNDHFSGSTKITKTTNGGNNWFSLTDPTTAVYDNMFILNENTIWVVSSSSLTGGVYRTTNGGQSWDRQFTTGTSHIYMYNARIGFIDGGGLKKTTDGGTSWTQVPGEGLFSDMHFVDSLTGWKCFQSMKKTTDGGLTWVNQTLPTGGNIVLNYMMKFSIINSDTIWGVGGTVYISGYGNRGMIFRTTNGGVNWLFQLPDSSIHIGLYSYVKFTDRKKGWAYSLLQGGVHTIIGGDDTFYTGLQQISSVTPDKFKLYQNYPNPFNPRTIIKYQIVNNIEKIANVKLIVYDITGKEIIKLINREQKAGSYEVDFSGNGLSSGVYFYKVQIISGKEVFTDTKKMLMIK